MKKTLTTYDVIKLSEEHISFKFRTKPKIGLCDIWIGTILCYLFSTHLYIPHEWNDRDFFTFPWPKVVVIDSEPCPPLTLLSHVLWRDPIIHFFDLAYFSRAAAVASCNASIWGHAFYHPIRDVLSPTWCMWHITSPIELGAKCQCVVGLSNALFDRDVTLKWHWWQFLLWLNIECLALCSAPWSWRKARENGENVTSFRGMAFVASDMGWPWTGWISPAPVQMSGFCLGAALSWLCHGLLQGLVVFSLTFCFSVNSHFGHSRAWSSACSSTWALLHCCFPSNFSTATQGTIVKLRWASSELCTLFIWSV